MTGTQAPPPKRNILASPLGWTPKDNNFWPRL